MPFGYDKTIVAHKLTAAVAACTDLHNTEPINLLPRKLKRFVSPKPLPEELFVYNDFLRRESVFKKEHGIWVGVNRGISGKTWGKYECDYDQIILHKILRELIKYFKNYGGPKKLTGQSYSSQILLTY